MKKFTLKQVIYFTVAIVLLSATAALQMKINIGIVPWDGLAKSISSVTGIKVGNATITMAISCVVMQAVVLRKDFKWMNILALVVGFINGKIINLFYYNIFSNLTIESYAIKLILFVLSIVAIAFFVGMIQTADFINLPLEGLCEAVADKGISKFSTLRQVVDVFSIISIVLITLTMKVPLTLREGTIISMIIFGPLLGFFIPYQQKFVEKYNIVSK